MPYKKGDQITVEFSGVVTEARTAAGDGDGRQRVQETGSGRWSHLLDLRLADTRIRHLPDYPGTTLEKDDKISVRFTATVTGEYQAGPSITTEVTDKQGVKHYVFEDSTFIKLSPKRAADYVSLGTGSAKPEPERKRDALGRFASTGNSTGEEPAMAVKQGDQVRVAFTGTIEAGAGQYGTRRVKERSGNVHYLFLNDGTIYAGDVPPPSRREAGDPITVDFTAAVYGKQGDSTSLTTEVQVPATGYTHFVYLGSPSVTTVPEPEPENKNSGEPVTRYAEGDEVRIEFEARITGERKYEASTVKMVEASGPGAGTVHYLYLSSPDEQSRILGKDTGTMPADGDLITVAFTGRVAGPLQDGLRDLTTRVYGPRTGGGSSFLHYVYLDSPSVRRASALESLGSEGQIESRKVIVRLEKLNVRKAKLPPLFTLTRNRNGELMEEFTDTAGVVRYLEDNDLDGTRFTSVAIAGKLPETDQRELDRLTALDLNGRTIYSGWDDGITLYPAGYFTEEWARDRAGRLCGDADLKEWPLYLLDWDEAASAARDADFLRIGYEGTLYYGEN